MMHTNKQLKINSKLRAIKSCQRGFSLIEILIAVLILAIGLLGVAGLQVTSKRSNYEAVQRATATMLIRDMIERIRANQGQLDTYTNTGAGRTFSPSAGISTAVTDCFGSGADCNDSTMATYDLYEWENALAGVTETNTATAANVGGLALPSACITGAASGTATAGLVTVAIAWRGLTPFPDQAAPGKNACGNDSGLYDDTANDDVYRRVIEVETFIGSIDS